MAENNAVVGLHNPHAEAEAIIKELQRSGFDMNKLFIVGKDYHTEQRVIGSSFYNAGRPHEGLGQTGGLLGWSVAPALRLSRPMS